MKPDKKRYNVCLMGASLETGNMGVSALAASLIKIVLEVKPNSSISFLVGSRAPKVRELVVSGRKIEIKVINYRLSPKAKVEENLLWILFMALVQRTLPLNTLRAKVVESNPFLSALSHAEFVGDIRGGDSFSDIYGVIRLTVGSIPAIIALLMKKKLVLLPQTYGPYRSLISKRIARYIVKRSGHIFSRDRQGTETFEGLVRKGFGSRLVKFCPDVAFRLESIKPTILDIQPPINLNPHIPLIGLNVNGLLYNGGYTQDNMFDLRFDYKSFVRELMLRLLEETNGHILLIPHTFGIPGNVNSDPDACREAVGVLQDRFKDRIHLVQSQYDQHEIKGIIGLCDFFIGSRMHACIAALSQGLPATGVAYSKKFKGVFDSVGVGHLVIDARKVNSETAILKILSFFRNRDEVREELMGKIDMAKSQIKTAFQELLSH